MKRELPDVLKAVESMPQQDRLAVALHCIDVEVERLRRAYAGSVMPRRKHLHAAAERLKAAKGQLHVRADIAARLLGDLP